MTREEREAVYAQCIAGCDIEYDIVLELLDAIDYVEEKCRMLEQSEDAKIKLYKGVIADRDRYDARCAALERAIKTKLTACSTCLKKPAEGYCQELYDCINKNWSYPCWQFDEQRFSE